MSLENLLGMMAGDGAQIMMGSIGWENEAEHFDLGTADNDGHTLVRVQLFEGRDHTQPINPKRAQGHKILCHLGTNMLRIPPPDTNVFVAVPKGMDHVPGASVIFTAVEQDRRYNLVEGDLTISTREGAGKVIVKNDGSIAIFSTADNTDDGKSVYFRVATDGFNFVAPWGTIKFDATGFHVLHSSGASLNLGGIYGLPTPLDQLGSYAKMSAAMIDLPGTAVSMGAGGAAPLAGATEVMAALGALQTQITLLAGVLTGLSVPPTGPVLAGAVATAMSGISSGMLAALAAITAAINPVTSTLPKSAASS